MKINLAVVILLLCSTWATDLKATHIVGGEMNYKCLGGQEFEVILTVYRDCYNGVPFFDSPASVGVFDAGGNLVTNLLIPYMSDDTLKPVLSGECFILPPNACVHTTTYRRVVTLPVSPGGYTLAYQRCCRNKTILNIEKPDSTGATFSIFISEEALLECNSSPTFKEWPPIYICVNEPILFDHSAIDEEGDSIVYRICTPLDGGTLGNPQPVPPAKPPYKEVIWRDPPYNLDNIMGGIPLTIDVQTGLLTGTPNTIGQFVVGICADEYRDGIIISSTRRDFQYNVGICGMTVSAFAAPEVQCGLTVNFLNASANADKFIWYFDLDNDLTATSTEANPVFTYPDSGTYTIMLIAQPEDKCVDTFIRTIRVELLSLTADFDFAFTECGDSLTLVVVDQSTDTISQIVQWQWRLASGVRVYTSQEQFPTFYIDTAGVWLLDIIVTAENGCKDTLRQIFPVRLANIPWPDTTLRMCMGDTILLNPQPLPGVTHIWGPNYNLSSASNSNPSAWPDSTTIYTLKTSSMNGLCKDERQITVEVSPPIVFEPPGDTAVCASPFLVMGQADRPVTWLWALDRELTMPLASENPAEITLTTSSWIYIFVIDDSGCEALDSFYVDYLALELILPDTLVLCPSEAFEIELQFPDPLDTLIELIWTPANFFPQGNMVNPAIVQIPDPGIYSIFVSAENQFGCISTDSLFIAVIDTAAGPEVISSVNCSGYRVLFNLDTPGDFAYTWNFGDPSQPFASAMGSSTSHTYNGPGSYTITVAVESENGCTDTVNYILDLNTPAVVLDFSWIYQTCADTAVVVLSDLSENSMGNIIQRTWFIDGLMAGNGEEITWIVTKPDSIEVTLIIDSDNGCTDTLTQFITVPIIQFSLEDSVALCPGDSIQLNPNGNPSYAYSWSPDNHISDINAASPWVQPLESTAYSVVVQLVGPDSCFVEGSVFVHVVDPPVAVFPNDTVTCLSAVILTVADADDVVVSWYGDPGLNQLLTVGPVLFQPIVGADRFYIQIEDNFGCLWYDSVDVRSSSLVIDLPELFVVCPGEDTLCLEASLSGDTIGAILEWTGSGLFTPTVDGLGVCISSNSPGFLLQVVAENEDGCSAIASSQVSILDVFPPVEASADPPIILPGESTTLTVTQGSGYTYLWSPASSIENPNGSSTLANPTTTTTYSVTVTDSNGCSSVAEVVVRVGNPVCEEPYIFVPNTFTPNGDNLNDLLFVRGLFIEQLYFIIYDRWGNEVFATRDQDIGWDGTYKGKLLSSDVFGYYLEVVCGDGTPYSKRGNVTLLRN